MITLFAQPPMYGCNYTWRQCTYRAALDGGTIVIAGQRLHLPFTVSVRCSTYSEVEEEDAA